MIDPRMIRPEAVAPTTDIVTPSPQYYGQGTVQGGQIQLGDVYGQLPSQSQEEYLYGNLASMAQSAMSIFTFPAQMEAAERQRKRAEQEKNDQHDQDKLFEYQTAQAELEQAQLDGKGTFEWGGVENDISSPESFSALNLRMQESILNGMKTKRGTAQAAEIRTGILATRNKDVDGRISELMEEYNREITRFESDPKHLLLNPEAYYTALQGDSKLNELKEQILSYRDTKSTQMEYAIRRFVEVDSKAARDSHAYVLDSATETVQNATQNLVDTLPDMMLSLDTPWGPAAFTEWVGDVPNAETLFDSLGVVQTEEGVWEIMSGSLLDSISKKQDPNDIRKLIETIVNHNLKSVSAFTSDADRESFAKRLTVSYVNQIRKITADMVKTRTNQEINARDIGIKTARSDYIAGKRNVVSDFFAGKNEEQAVALTIVGLKDPNNKRQGPERRDFVLEDARNAVIDNMGTPGIVISSRQERAAQAYLGVNDLLTTGLYEVRDDGMMYLSQAGEIELQKRSYDISRKVFNSDAYMDLIKDGLDTIKFSGKYTAAKSIDELEQMVNKDLIAFVRTNFPVGSTSDDDLLISMGLKDLPQGYAKSTELSKLMDVPVTRVFQGVAQDIIKQYGQSVNAAATDAAQIPEFYKPFDTTDLSKVLSDSSIESTVIAAEFSRKMTEAGTDDEKVRDVIQEYTKHPWMKPHIMQNIIAKSRQLDQRTALADTMLLRLSDGTLGPERTPGELYGIDPLKFTKKLPIKNPAEFWTNARYFDQQASTFTKEGAELFAIWTSSFLSGPVSDDQRQEMQGWMNEVSTSEINNLQSPTALLDGGMSGVPLLMLAEVVATAESYKAGGIAALHDGARKKYSRNISYTDPTTGKVEVLDLSYNPEAALKTDHFMTILGNPNEKTTNMGLAFSRLITHALRGTGGMDRTAARDFVRRKARMFAGLMLVDSRDIGNRSSSILGSAGPVGKRGALPLYPNNASEFIPAMQQQLATGNHADFVNGFVSLSNIFTTATESYNVVTDANRASMFRDVLISGAMLAQSQQHHMRFPISKRFADSYNKDKVNDSEGPLTEGDILPLWGDEGGRDIMSILFKMTDDELSDDKPWNPGGVEFGAGDKETRPLEYEMNDWIFKYLYHTLNMPTPGTTTPSLLATIPIYTYLQQENILSVPENGSGSVIERLNALFSYQAIIDGYNNIGGYLPSTFQDYRGLQLGTTRRRTLPPAYHYNGSPINLGWGNNLTVENSDGDRVPLFADKRNEIAASFLLASPSTSTDPGKFAKTREEYFYNNLIPPGKPPAMNPSGSKRIKELAESNISNIQFLQEASEAAKEYLPSTTFFPFRFDGLVFNNANLPDQQFIRSWDKSGYSIMIDKNNLQGEFQINRDGHMLIGLNGTPGGNIIWRSSLPLSPEIMRLIDLSALGRELVLPQSIREQRLRSQYQTPLRSQSDLPASTRVMNKQRRRAEEEKRGEN